MWRKAKEISRPVSSDIRKVVEISISNGRLDGFKKVAATFVERVKQLEPGTIGYEWYLRDDGSKCFVLEWYQDDGARMAHLANVQDLYEPLSEVSQITRIKVFGHASEELRQAQLPGTDFRSPWIGVVRWDKEQ
jgi:quinol monooxygenase YgiN